ncbi:MAG: carotenoid biosynthesis protein [Bacteroidetes bacterium]|nr:carotenoid biosynthesis protein [Bacteroidota bacterium]
MRKKVKPETEFVSSQETNTCLTFIKTYWRVGILLLFHLIGFCGLLVNPLYFSSLTPYNLLLSAALVLSAAWKQSLSFWLSAFGLILAGIGIEIAGVRSGVIFGHYTYGEALGFKLPDVPLLIGINWLLLLYGCIQWTRQLHPVPAAFITALLMTTLDFFIEQVAPRFDFWYWQNDHVPGRNFVAWFIISFFLSLVASRWLRPRENHTVKWFLVIQYIFFIGLFTATYTFNPHHTYLWLDIASVFFPFVLSFDKKVAFYKSWKYLWPGVIINAIFFIAWDIWFTDKGIWSFSPGYISGIYLFNLPIEEVLFFICAPYACVFIYDVLRAYISRDLINTHARKISIVLSVLMLLACVVFYNRTYTLFNSAVALVLVVVNEFVFKNRFMGWFYLAFLVSLIPFLLFDGLITAIPIVSYNDAENSGIRIYSIPLEDLFYCLSLLLFPVQVMEYLRKKKV